MQKTLAFASRIPIALGRGNRWHNFYKLMKISFYGFIIALITAQSLTAEISKAQDIKEVQITFGVRNVTLKYALNKLQKESGYNVFYLSPKVTPYRDISIPMETRSVKETLELLLHSTPFDFRQEGRMIILTDRFLPVLLDQTLPSLEKQIRGKVTDENGEGLPGVNILLKGSQQGTITDENGNFQLVVENDDAVLILSFVGYLTEEAQVGTQTTLEIVLKSDEKVLEEVLVVGYGTQRKSDITGSVASVPKDRMEKVPNLNVAQIIQGSVPGVMIQQTSSGAETSHSVMIRGRNSITASNSPLVIIDGIPGGLNDVNPKDIESIEVLKDASAAAIYGSRGANGVILITTAKGREGKPKIAYSGYVATQNYINIPAVLNGEEFYEFKLQRDAPAMTIFEEDIYSSGKWVNWQELATRKGFGQQHNISVSGGSKNTSYYLNGGIQDIKGVAVNDNYQRVTGRVNISTHLADWLKIGTNTQIAHIDRSGVGPSWGDVFNHNPLSIPYDENGNYTVYPQHWDTHHAHPLAPTLYDDTDKSLLINTNNYLSLNFPFVPGLNYQLNTGIRLAYDDRETYRKRDTKTGLENRGWADVVSERTNKTLVENILSYRRELGNHRLFITLLYSFENNVSKTSLLNARQFPHDFLTIYSVSQAELRNPEFRYNEDHLISKMFRLNYSYDSRYLLTLTARRDGYSGFGSNNKWGLFPSVAFGYNIANENFFPSNGLFNEMKIRASWGLNGNQAVGAYQTIAKLEPFNIVSQKTTYPGYRPGSLAVENLSWESSSTYNFGLDFGIMHNRLRGELNLFKTVTRDLLLDRRISSVHGLTSILQNTGKTQNNGFEAVISSTIMAKKNLKWTTTGNITFIRNKILSLYGETDEVGNEFDDIANSWFIGQPILVNYHWEWLGTWQLYEADEAARYGSQPGFVKVRDTNGDGRLTAEDRVILGQRDPKFLWGLTNILTYKNFDLQFFIHGMHGHQRLNELMSDATLAEVRQNTTKKNWWTTENPTNDWIINHYDARIAPGAGTINWYEKSGFIRLKDISLSYNLKPSLLDKTGLGKFRVYVTGRNVYTHTAWTGLDPEVSSARTTPMQREFVLGLDIEF